MDIREYNPKKLPYHFVLFYNLSSKDMVMYQSVLKGKPRDNAVLTYCYLDLMCGLSYRAICCAKIYGDGTIEYDVSDKIDTGMIIREGGLESDAVIIDEGGPMEQFQKEVDTIKECYGYYKERVEVSDEKPFDEFRHPAYPDDILVYFFSPDKKIEQIWVREKSHKPDGTVTGFLINEPYNELIGLHDGDTVQVIPYDMGNGEIIPAAILPWMRE